jgi:hypothetical protein
MNDGPNATWLPNLVGGVSIWKLAVDLNEAKFFDGRLLVPETEGSESLPVTVRWDLTGLVPLKDARAKYPTDVERAVKDFQGALERVAKVFATKDSGFDKYKTAFTVPSVDAEDGGNYFYSPTTQKLYVINWGASPRSMAGRAEYVFGYEDWAKTFKNQDGGVVGAGSVSALATASAVAAADAAKKDEKKKEEEEKKKEEKETAKKDDGKKRPWWMWPLFALIAIALILLALFLLKACEEQNNLAAADGGEAGAEAATDGSNDSAASADAMGAGGDAAGSGDAMADAAGDGGGDAGADAAGADGGDAGKDGGKDASASNDDDDDDGDDTDSDIELGPDGKPKPGGKVTITMGGAPGGALPAAKKAPHRRHYQAEAVKWRVASGNEKVTRTETRGKRFDVWLARGKTFQGVGVEWQDKAGKWHAH